MAEAYEKIVVVTRETALEELIVRFNTRDQARFYLGQMGASFEEYQAAHDAYHQSLHELKEALPRGVRHQFIGREFLPNFSFGPQDCVVTLGPDGLVVNTAKYLTTQPLLAFNPDIRRIDGVLIPFRVEQAHAALPSLVRGAFGVKKVSMARATLNDGQSLHAVNDLFIGQKSHVSARYRLKLGRHSEQQSSSGVIVSTGAGSTGWLRSVVTGAHGIVEAEAGAPHDEHAAQSRFDWEADHLIFSVREPFVSKVSSADLVFGRIEAGKNLEIVSQMPQNGVIFSDGVEADYLEFNSGAIADIGIAPEKLHLVTRVY